MSIITGEQVETLASAKRPTLLTLVILTVVSLSINLVAVGAPGLVFITNMRADITSLQQNGSTKISEKVDDHEKRLTRQETQTEEVLRRLGSIESDTKELLRLQRSQ